MGVTTPHSSPACCGWSCGAEVTGGDTAAQSAATRTIVGSAENAGGHAPPALAEELKTPLGQPSRAPGLGTSRARDIPRHWVAPVVDEDIVLMSMARHFEGGTGTELGIGAGVTIRVAPAEPRASATSSPNGKRVRGKGNGRRDNRGAGCFAFKIMQQN